MKRLIVILISLISFINIALAQDATLIVQGINPNLYLLHKTAAKENFYSVSRMYNVSPKDIAAYNNLTMETGLNLGQVIKIPLTQNNFVQTAGADKSLMPVYHVMQAKEGLYRVSVNYNKVPLAQLKSWNNLSSDVVSTGTKLIVGYLKSQDGSSVSKNVTDTKSETIVMPKEKEITQKPKEVSKETAAQENQTTPEKPVNTESQPASAQTPEMQESKNSQASYTSINFNGGAFKKLYEDQHLNKSPVTESGQAGVFKSTSGWRDGKYYCFNNNAPAGTIVKITNSLNGKSVYAKVLDLIPDISQNAGLVLHVSNAAADELGVTGTRFDCSINYVK